MAATEIPSAPLVEMQTPKKPLDLRVLPLDAKAEALWDQYVRSHPSGTFFHQVGWKRVMEKTYGYKPFYFYVEREGSIAGIAPSFLVSNWITGPCLVSVPFAVYGGVCASDPSSESTLIGHLEKVAKELNVEHLELRNRCGEILPDYHANHRYSTFTFPLGASTEALYQGFPKDIRYMIRKGEKAGLRAHHGLEQLDVFYHLMTVNLRRLGTPAFPRALFKSLIDEYPGQVSVTVVYAGAKPVAGGMAFSFREWMQPYYIGSLDEAKSLAANNFLWWEFIKLAVEKGHTIFDFGRSKNDSGNFDFKKKWNPKIEPLCYQVRLMRRTGVPNFTPTNPAFQIATNLWKKLPLSLTRIVGPRVVRWFP